MNYTEQAILGLPIITDLGEVQPLSIFDYVRLEKELHVVSFESSRVLHEYRKTLDEKTQKSKELEKQLEEVMKERSLKDIIIGLVPAYFNAYVAVIAQSMYLHIEDEEERVTQAFELLQTLDGEQFNNLREVILRANSQGKQEAFLDYELQRMKERGIRFNSEGSDGISITTMISSVVTFSGIDYDIVKGWNYARLIHAFNRIAMFKAYDTTTLFMTVSSDVEAKSWQENYEVKDDSSTSSSFATSFDSFTKGIGSDL